MSIATKLLRVNAVKHEIASAITEKGVTVKNSDPFSKYPNLISQINTETGDPESGSSEIDEPDYSDGYDSYASDPDTTPSELNVVPKPETITENGTYKASDEDPSILADMEDDDTTSTENETGTGTDSSTTSTTTSGKTKKKSNKVDGYSSVEVAVGDSASGSGYTVNWYSPDKSSQVQKLVTSNRSDKEITSELSSLGNGGNVDLTKRPKVSGAQMSSKGWDVGDSEASTVETKTYVNSEGKWFNFTPIVANGSNLTEVMSESELDSYAESVINGEREDDKGCQIGGSHDSQNDAEADAIRIHDLHGVLLDRGYFDSGYILGSGESPISSLTNMDLASIYNSGNSNTTGDSSTNTAGLTKASGDTPLDSVSGIDLGGHASFLGITPPMPSDGDVLKPFIFWTPKTDYIAGNKEVIGLFDDKDVDFEAVEQWKMNLPNDKVELFKGLEIKDSWKEIASNKGASYPIGSWKLLLLDMRLTEEEKTAFENNSGTGLGPAVNGVYPIQSFPRAIIMRKVYEHEGDSTSTWVSDTIMRLPVDWNIQSDDNNHYYIDWDGTDYKSVSSPVDVFLNKPSDNGFWSYLDDKLYNAMVPMPKPISMSVNEVTENGFSSYVPESGMFPDRRIWIPSAYELGDTSCQIDEENEVSYDEALVESVGSLAHAYSLGVPVASVKGASIMYRDQGSIAASTYLTRTRLQTSPSSNPYFRTASAGSASFGNLNLLNNTQTRFLYRIGFCL